MFVVSGQFSVVGGLERNIVFLELFFLPEGLLGRRGVALRLLGPALRWPLFVFATFAWGATSTACTKSSK